MTPIHAAAAAGHCGVVKALLSEGFGDVNEPDRRGYTALSTVCVSGKADIAIELLQHGADHTTRDLGGMTPLHTAVLNRNGEVARALLDHNADVDIMNSDGVTVLCAACVNKDVGMLESLLKAKANPNLRRSKQDVTPLHVAATRNDTECIKLLLDHKASLSEIWDKFTPAETALREGSREAHAVLMAANEEIQEERKAKRKRDCAERQERREGKES